MRHLNPTSLHTSHPYWSHPNLHFFLQCLKHIQLNLKICDPSLIVSFNTIVTLCDWFQQTGWDHVVGGSFLQSHAVTEITSCFVKLCLSLWEAEFFCSLCKNALLNYECILCFQKYFVRNKLMPFMFLDVILYFYCWYFVSSSKQMGVYIENGFECLWWFHWL